MEEKNIRIYLLGNLSLIIGEDNGKIIKDAVAVLFTMRQGIRVPALSALYKGIDVGCSLGVDLDKRNMNILDAKETTKELIDGYKLYLSGEKLKPKSNIVVPKIH